MKKLYLLSLISYCVLSTSFSFAQVGQWTWMQGSNTPASTGSFGSKGVPALTNEPPALYEACEWTDLNGNFWLYGGTDQSFGTHDDLWQYNPATNMWTWMKGTGTSGDLGTYGSQGVPSVTNQPPSKGFGAASWVDLAGNLWMFGGQGFGGTSNDLWQYDIAANTWTWMKGTNTPGDPGNYGTIGVGNILNNPPSRNEAAASWTDDNGDLWFFGGTGFNDMWRYNIAGNTWTWMKGTNLSNQPGIYGTKGVEAPANTPGNRWVHCRWKDKTGNLWLFGGLVGGGIPQNDLWRFNPTTNNWTWMNGSSTINQPGVYGTKCVTDASNTPGGRYESRSAWVDSSGNFWMFGGIISTSSGMVNDLWMYCPISNHWTWVSGDSTSTPVGSWGTKGVSSATNKPNGRMGSIGWSDNKGNLYLFGGSTDPWATMYNDLWKYSIDPTCGAACVNILPPVTALSSSDSSICTNDCISFTDLSTNNPTTWLWTFTGATPPVSTDKNPNLVCYLDSGTFSVTLVATNAGGSDTISVSNLINVKNSPPTPNIIQSGDTLFCSFDSSYVSYQWYADSALIPNATNSSYIADHDGNYNVRVNNINGCGIAVGINVVIKPMGTISLTNHNLFFTISPNPANDQLLIKADYNTGSSMFTIFNVLGEKILSDSFYSSGSKTEIPINIKSLSDGIYFIQLKSEKGSITAKFVKE